MPAVHLLPIGLIDPELLQRLADEIPRFFQTPVVVDAPLAPAPAWRAAPGRFDAGAVLDGLIARAPEDGGWSLGLLDGDLVAPGVGSSCGFATLGGCCGVLALAPILREAEPLADRPAAFRRLLLEAVHEIGHLAGLGHCDDPACVMAFSQGPREAGRKEPEFCSRCRENARSRG